MKVLLAEFLGAFFLVFIGTGAVIIDQEGLFHLGNLGIALAFGGVVVALILVFSRWAGIHLNPAVTLALWVASAFPKSKIIAYIGCQIAGALCGSLLLHLLFPFNISLGNTFPTSGIFTSFVLEMGLTFILMLCILIFTKIHVVLFFKAVIIAFIVFIAAWKAGPLCGASMNPARSLAPSLVSGDFEFLWIYLLAPILGAIAASLVWNIFKLSLKNKAI